jgi:predicted metalloendopeptidase
MLGLPNKHYYRAGMKNRIFLKYVKFLQLLGKHMNIDMLESAATIETLMLPYLTQSDDGPMSAEYIYTPLSYTELTSKYKHIAWRELMNGWGAPEAVYTRATYIVTNTQYLKHLNSLFDGEAFTLDMWRTWMRAMTLLTFVEYLPPPFDDYHFELFGRALKGQTEKLPQKYLTLGVLQQHAKHDLGRLFVDHAVMEGTKAHATRLIKQLKKATIRRIRAIEWMSESTRAAAIAKVEHMKFQVAHPDHWVSETAAVRIDVHHPLTNMINLLVHDTDKMIQDLKHGRCERSEKVWNDGAFEVNAYYYSESNMMVVPAGILRAPFFDLAKSDAWNLGGIGVTIGHEITHGFDAEGRLYDQRGLYNNWWTDDDVAMYNKVTQQVIDLYDGERYMGGRVNGKLTLSENMADLGGMAIGLEALNTLLETVKDVEKRKAAYRDFFISYAVSWRNKDRAKKAKESLFLDVHAPAPLRVNLIVKQFDEFYVAFDVKPGDAGYIPPEERIRLW